MNCRLLVLGVLAAILPTASADDSAAEAKVRREAEAIHRARLSAAGPSERAAERALRDAFAEQGRVAEAARRVANEAQREESLIYIDRMNAPKETVVAPTPQPPPEKPPRRPGRKPKKPAETPPSTPPAVATVPKAKPPAQVYARPDLSTPRERAAAADRARTEVAAAAKARAGLKHEDARGGLSHTKRLEQAERAAAEAAGGDLLRTEKGRDEIVRRVLDLADQMERDTEARNKPPEAEKPRKRWFLFF